MKKSKFMVKKVALNVLVENHDLRRDYGVNPLVAREMKQVERLVSPQLYGMLVQQLLGFHADMQLEMAEDLAIFACEQIAHSTGCPSVDFTLDICYTWIAAELGIIKKGYRGMIH